VSVGDEILRRPCVIGFAYARVAAGATRFIALRFVGRIWIGSRGDDPGVALITRSFAIRDVGLGLGTAFAARRDQRVTGWAEACLLSDVGDLFSVSMRPPRSATYS
jgi:hypothetical protein